MLLDFTDFKKSHIVKPISFEAVIDNKNFRFEVTDRDALVTSGGSSDRRTISTNRLIELARGLRKRLLTENDVATSLTH